LSKVRLVPRRAAHQASQWQLIVRFERSIAAADTYVWRRQYGARSTRKAVRTKPSKDSVFAKDGMIPTMLFPATSDRAPISSAAARAPRRMKCRRARPLGARPHTSSRNI
jgi:hypothetical protein